LISLVVVGVCIAATTWIVMKGGGQPATTATDGHREPDEGTEPPLDGPVSPAEEPLRDPGPEPVSLAEVQLLEPEPEPEPVSVPEVRRQDQEPEPEPVEPLAPPARRAHRAVPAADGVVVAAAPAALPRSGRTRAPERVRARRRDHVKLGRHPSDADEALLVAPTEVPAPQPARMGATRRLRSGLTLLAIVLVVGTGAAVMLGVAIVVISDVLENAVK
jgi:hypothetical protein